MLNEGDEESGMTRFDPYDLKFDLIEIGEDGKEVYVFEEMSFEDFNARRIWVNTVDRETAVDISKTYKLRMWLDENVIVSDTNPSADYPATGFENYYASVRVSVFGDFVEKDISYRPNYMARVSDMQVWPTDILNSMQTISEVQFVSMGETEIATRYEAATVKADITATTDDTVQETSARQMSAKPKAMDNTKGGNVYVWLEADLNNEDFNIMYVVSDGFTYLPNDCSMMFAGFMNVTNFVFENINTSEVTDMGGMFYYCASLTTLDLSKFDTSNVTTFTKIMENYDGNGNTMYTGMFQECFALTSLNLKGWNTSKVTNMSSMFAACAVLNELDVSHFDTRQVTNMSSMFSSCTALTSLNLKQWDTSSITNMSNMFSYCKSLTYLNINSWDTSNVLDMSFMFYDCRSLTRLNVSHFDTSSVTNMSSMFCGLQSLTELDVSNFDTSNVTSMGRMFGFSTDIDGGGLGITKLDVSNFDTSNVVDFAYLFTGCQNVAVLEVQNWNTSKATTMLNTFSGCTSLISLDLSAWNTSSVTDMQAMFYGCSSLINLILNGWDTSLVTKMGNMFERCSSLESLNLSSFNTTNVTDKMLSIFDGCTSLKTLDVSNFVFNGEGILYTFRNMPTDATVIVGTTTEQNWILALETDNSRPAEWTTDNVILKSQL